MFEKLETKKINPNHSIIIRKNIRMSSNLSLESGKKINIT